MRDEQETLATKGIKMCERGGGKITDERNDGRKTLTKNRANHPQNPPSDGADHTTTKQDNYTSAPHSNLPAMKTKNG